MKNLKTLLVIALFSLLPGVLLAQGFGIRAGVNLQNINGKDYQNDQLKNKLTPGFNIGVNYEIPVGTDIYFQPGLLFTTKGSKIDRTEFKTKLSTSNIELPLNLVFKPLLGTGHILLGFGPYVAYGIGGKGKSDSYDVQFASNAGTDQNVIYLRPFDAGANFIIGYEMASMFSLQLNAQLGLIDIFSKSATNDESWKNTGFGFSIGYRF